MMRKLSKSVVVCLFAVAVALPTSAAPRGRSTGFIEYVKQAVVHVLDTIEIGWPKP